VEPYKLIITTDSVIDKSDCVFMVDNETLRRALESADVCRARSYRPHESTLRSAATPR
jgi:hypothetical protein